MKDKTILPSKLLWVDLEMTGLDPDKDLILEVAAQITDFDFKTVSSYESKIYQEPKKIEKLLKANSWYTKEFPENIAIFLNGDESKKTSIQVEDDLIELVKKDFNGELAILAGNSIHKDRSFVTNYWPRLNKLLHYRMLDVSAWKIVMNSKFNVEYQKKSNHRAIDDIQASILELKFYLEWLNQSNNYKDL